MLAEPHLTCIFTWFGSRHFECYVTKLVPGPYQLFLPNQTTRTPSSFNMKSMSKEGEKIESSENLGCLPFDRKIRSASRKHNYKRYTSLPQNCYIRYSLNPKKGRICVAWVWNQEGTEKLVNGKQHSVWFVRTGMNGLPQNALLNFRLEFPKSDLTIYLPSGISDIFCQVVSTLGLGKVGVDGGGGGVQFQSCSPFFQHPLVIIRKKREKYLFTPYL